MVEDGPDLPVPPAWEPPEVMGFGIIGAAGLVVLFTVLTAVIAAFSSPNVPTGPFHGVTAIPGPSTAQTVLEATQWASILFALLPLAALGAVWWQVQGWTDVINDDDENVEEYTKAFGHLLRARLLGNVTMATFCLLIAATTAAVVASFSEDGGQGISTDLIAGYVGESGVGVATCLICASGIWAGLRLRSSVDSTFANGEAEPES